MISIDFAANLGLSEFGTRMGQGSAQGHRKNPLKTTKIRKHSWKIQSQELERTQNPFKTSQSPKMSILDFRIFGFRIFPKILFTFFSKTIKSLLTKNRRYPIKILTNPADL